MVKSGLFSGWDTILEIFCMYKNKWFGIQHTTGRLRGPRLQATEIQGYLWQGCELWMYSLEVHLIAQPECVIYTCKIYTSNLLTILTLVSKQCISNNH